MPEPKRAKPFYGWWIVSAVVGIQLMLAGLLVQAYGTYATAWRETFGWTSTIISLAYGIHRLQRGFLSPVQGLVLQRFGARRTMRVGMILFGGGLLLLSRVDTLWFFFAAFLTASIGTSLTGALSISTVLVNWFARRRATALALMNTGKSLGGMAVPAVAWAIAAWGWRTSLVVSGTLALVAGLLLTQLIHTRPEEVGLAPDGAGRPGGGEPADEERAADDHANEDRAADDHADEVPGADDHTADDPAAGEGSGEGRAAEQRAADGRVSSVRTVEDEPAEDGDDEERSAQDPAGGAHGSARTFSTREALRTRAFWLLSCGHALAVSVVSAVIVHLVLYLSESDAYSLQTAAGFFALMTGFSIAGQLVGGPLGDRMEKRKLAGVAALGHAAGAVVLAMTQSAAGVVAFAVLHGLAWGVRAPLMGALRADYFGREKYATIMGFSSSVVMLGSIAGPVVVGVAADAGSYQLGFGLVAILAIGASACFLLARDPAPNEGTG